MAYVVDTGHKENFGRFATGDAPEAVGNTLGGIAAYAAVHGIGHTEEFVPLAAVGEAVAMKTMSAESTRGCRKAPRAGSRTQCVFLFRLLCRRSEGAYERRRC